MTRSVEVPARLVNVLRRDLVGLSPRDNDIERERLRGAFVVVPHWLHRARSRCARGCGRIGSSAAIARI